MKIELVYLEGSEQHEPDQVRMVGPGTVAIEAAPGGPRATLRVSSGAISLTDGCEQFPNDAERVDLIERWRGVVDALGLPPDSPVEMVVAQALVLRRAAQDQEPIGRIYRNAQRKALEHHLGPATYRATVCFLAFPPADVKPADHRAAMKRRIQQAIETHPTLSFRLEGVVLADDIDDRPAHRRRTAEVEPRPQREGLVNVLAQRHEQLEHAPAPAPARTRTAARCPGMVLELDGRPEVPCVLPDGHGGTCRGRGKGRGPHSA